MDDLTYVAFLGFERIASGSLEETLLKTKRHTDGGDPGNIPLIFEDQTGRQIDFDLRGAIEEVLNRLAPKPIRSGPGRPRLGVTSREISLLPRHWEWLETQPNGASATLRRLVDEERKRYGGESQVRAKIDATGRIMTALGGNLPDFEEAYRSLYARDHARLEQWISAWPPDLRDYLLAGVS